MSAAPTSNHDRKQAEYTRKFKLPRKLYPFKEHWLTRGGDGMHYLDEGKGRPVLMLHGNPTWSFMYRELIKGLKGTARCIAPDYPGFGHSAAAPDYEFSPEEHAEWVGALIDRLGLEDIVLVLHDWGGPIGLSLAVQEPRRFAGIVLCNTFCWPADLKMRAFSMTVGGAGLGTYLNLQRNFFADTILRAGIFKREKRTQEVLGAYTAPFPTPESRLGTWVFPRAIRTSGRWMQGIEDALPELEGLPVEMVWAMRDIAFGNEKYIRRWIKHFPTATLTRVSRAGHYLLEDDPEAVLAAAERLLARLK